MSNPEPTKDNITFAEWLKLLAIEAAPYGYPADNIDAETWGGYYHDGYTPRAAVEEDASYQ